MVGSMVSRRQCMATVVPRLASARGPAWSRPRLSTVMSASVRSGSISEMAPTKVVLPTAKPPATTIFMETGVRSMRGPESKSTDAIEQLLEVRDVGGDAGRGGGIDVDGAGGGEVADEDADDADGERDAAGDLGEGGRRGAELDDGGGFGGVGTGWGHHLGRRGADGAVERDRRPGRSGASTGEDVRADHSGVPGAGATDPHRPRDGRRRLAV